MTNQALAYLETYSSQNTVRVYQSGLRKFFKVIYRDNDLNQADKYVNEDRDHEADLKAFFVTIKDTVPKSIQRNISIVRTFFVENSIRVDDRVWRSLSRRINGKGPATIVRVPTTDEFKRILSHMDVKGRAFFLMLASSGMRSGEALQLKLSDIDLDSDPVRLDVKAKYVKGGNRRWAFISTEAKEALEEWLTIRDRYIPSSSKK